MKTIRFITFLLFLIIQACAEENNQNVIDDKGQLPDTVTAALPVKDTFTTGKIIPSVICKADASQSYALYIPKGDHQDTMPVVFFFDPHADGVLPLNKYQSLADKYDYIFIGSNNSKNGNDWSTTDNIWNTLLNDVQQRMIFNRNRIYVCGFSGGAKVAGNVALKNNSIKGVVADGAGLPDGTPAGNFTFSFTAMAGKGDMNMADIVELNNNLNATKTNHRIILFNGKHEWAPANMMNIAFAGWQLDAMRAGVIKKNDVFIANYINQSKRKINSFISSNQLIDAGDECSLSANMLNNLSSEVKWFNDKLSSLKNNLLYAQQLKQQQQLLDKEQQIKATYNQQFQQGDINYWKQTIADLQKKAKPLTEEAAMYQRLLAYLSLAFYSVSNQLINGNQNDAATHFVELYKLADSANNEAWYFSAVLNAKINNALATKNDLEKAISYGFNDKQRLMQQPEFERMAKEIDLTGLANTIK